MVETQLNAGNIELMGYLHSRPEHRTGRTVTVAPATGAVEEPRD
jgi:hypothetical protein